MDTLITCGGLFLPGSWRNGAWAVGTKREVTIKSAEDIETDRTIFVLTMRMDIRNRFQASEPVAAYLFNGPI